MKINILTPASRVLLLMLLVCGAAELPPPDRPYNILMLLPCSSISHRNVFMPVATALANRGHKITMLTNNPAADNNPNITYLEHGLPHFNATIVNVFDIADDPAKMFTLIREMMPKLSRDIYKVPVVMELYNKRKEFDIIIIDEKFSESMFVFAHEQVWMTIATSRLDPANSATMGNLLNPAYVSNMMHDFPRPFSFVDRVKNLFFSIVVPISWANSMIVPTQVEISRIFPSLPPLADIFRNQSLTLINSHHTIDEVIPLLPNQVEIAGMHLRPGKDLPKEIETFLSGTTPVVYFSLGSIARSSDIPPKLSSIIKSAFTKLNYKLIWKFEDEIKDLPENILVQKWMPQQDILAHPNIKVFISHCGWLGSQEALYHKTPVLGMPIFGDQPKNCQVLERAGVARIITWNKLTEKLFVDTIKELVTNPSYSRKVSAISSTFRDQITTPTERAVYWTEYVIRHRGAPHLRSPAVELSWVETLSLDILLLMHCLMFLIVAVLMKFLGFCFRCFKSVNKSKNE